MIPPTCSCFDGVDLSDFDLARCPHGDAGDPLAEPTRTIVSPGPLILYAASES